MNINHAESMAIEFVMDGEMDACTACIAGLLKEGVAFTIQKDNFTIRVCIKGV